MSCYHVVKGVRVYDLRSLQKTEGEYYESDGLRWNFCAYLPGSQTFAEILSDGTDLTSWRATADEATELNNGVKVFRQSNVPCSSGGNYSFTAVVECKAKRQG